MTALSAFCEQHQLERKLNDLFHLVQMPNLNHTTFISQMESFDRIKVEGMKFAEKQCRHLHMGLVQFSLMLNFWQQSQELWDVQ